MINVTIIPVGMLGTNCYLLADSSKECAIIDPGAQPDKIAQMIEKAKLKPRYILLTHGHHDHIGGVNRLAQLFPGVEICIGEKDVEMLQDASKSLAAVRSQRPEEYLVEGVRGVMEGEQLSLGGVEIAVHDTPGHTKGGVTYCCSGVLFTGDTLFAGDVGRTDLYGGDYPTLQHSLAKIAALEGNYQVYPGHGEATTLEQERKNNRYIHDSIG